MKEVKKRQIILETDGNSVSIIKAEVSGSIEFKAILQLLIDGISKLYEDK